MKMHHTHTWLCVGTLVLHICPRIDPLIQSISLTSSQTLQGKNKGERPINGHQIISILVENEYWVHEILNTQPLP